MLLYITYFSHTWYKEKGPSKTTLVRENDESMIQVFQITPASSVKYSENQTTTITTDGFTQNKYEQQKPAKFQDCSQPERLTLLMLTRLMRNLLQPCNN